MSLLRVRRRKNYTSNDGGPYRSLGSMRKDSKEEHVL